MLRIGTAVALVALLALSSGAQAQIPPLASIGTAHEKVLAELLDPTEVEILHERLTAVLAAEAFPAPGTGRSFPWPPV